VGEGGDGGVAKLIDVPESRIAIFTASASWALLPYLGVVALPRRCCPISAGLLDLGVPEPGCPGRSRRQTRDHAEKARLHSHRKDEMV
jgi:hypothetical protein